ncbi:Knottin [Corchorus olitorius]|uniref:Knottin n=1 Tax=Corchorus olitorius TaxID=93759 RepID=A0A1R3HZ61_9ROSI|nr:Knottin [Corchorus olitorius]
MAKSLSSFATFLALLCLFFLLSTPNEMKMAEAKICEKRSQTWSGWCGNSSHCDRQCKNWENARHGSCHADGLGWACFCYFNC